MESKYLNELIIKKQDELGELLKVQAIVEEVSRLSIVKANVLIYDTECRIICGNFSIYIKGDNTGQVLERTVEHLVDYFSEAEKVILYVNDCGLSVSIGGTVGDVLTKQLSRFDKFTVTKSR